MLRHRIGPTAAWAAFVIAACVSVWHTPAGAATAVTACGQVYSGSGMLTADLDCTGLAATAAVRIEGGSLDLQGFTLTGGNLDAVFCTKNCRVFSSAPGGMIRGAGNHTVRGAAPGPNLTVEDISLDANGRPRLEALDADDVMEAPRADGLLPGELALQPEDRIGRSERHRVRICLPVVTVGSMPQALCRTDRSEEHTSELQSH